LPRRRGPRGGGTGRQDAELIIGAVTALPGLLDTVARAVEVTEAIAAVRHARASVPADMAKVWFALNKAVDAFNVSRAALVEIRTIIPSEPSER
jgi:hypothetical protein